MNVEFECVICGKTATATVTDEDAGSGDEPLETLHDCPNCGMETIWIES
jgi:DNA-directed RNA polymerase subunit M/transcription elongation factor TFIIS